MVITSACGADNTGSIPVGHPKAGLLKNMAQKKILLISVSAGSGHVRAAQAIEKTAKAKFPEMDITHIDMMDYVSLPLKKTVINSYNILAQQLPGVWGFFYKKTNKLKISKFAQKMAGLLNTLNTGPFYNYLKTAQKAKC